jgi:hypothetical protein
MLGQAHSVALLKYKNALFNLFTPSGFFTYHNVVVILVVGAYQHCSHEGLLYSNPPMEFRCSSPEALHTKRRERRLLAKDGTKFS